MKVLILSDVHGNLSAMDAFSAYIQQRTDIDAVILLGDLIDYGLHSNQVVKLIQQLPFPVICNIRGNHEQAIITGDYSRFSSNRGKECAKFTGSILTSDTINYITNVMANSGMYEFMIKDKKCLAVHGSIEDIYWKSIFPQQDLSAYQKYDYVFSGHSHLPHFFERFFDAEDAVHRNKKKTIFINPGSLGQPRNLNPMAQFALLDTDSGEVLMKKLAYDIKKEQKAYTGQVDDFYKIRLERGV